MLLTKKGVALQRLASLSDPACYSGLHSNILSQAFWRLRWCLQQSTTLQQSSIHLRLSVYRCLRCLTQCLCSGCHKSPRVHALIRATGTQKSITRRARQWLSSTDDNSIQDVGSLRGQELQQKVSLVLRVEFCIQSRLFERSRTSTNVGLEHRPDSNAQRMP